MQEHIPEKNIRSGPPCINIHYNHKPFSIATFVGALMLKPLPLFFYSYLFTFVTLVTYCTQITTPLRGEKQWC